MRFLVDFLTKILCFTFLLNSPLYAQDFLFKKGRCSFEYQTGIMFSPILVHEDLPDFNYWQTNLRINRMLNTPHGKGILRGNFEGILELTTASIIEGEGSYMVGIGPIIRYNFIRPKWKLIPYVQAGCGICYTDAYYYEAIGQGFNFTLQTGIGIKYLLKKDWAVDLETRYHHVSNADMDERNKGINAIGFTVGITYYFH